MKKSFFHQDNKQKIKSTAKKFLFDIIRIKAINILLRGLLKPISPILPDKVISRIPAVGRIRLPLPNSKVLVLASDGSDSLASALYWNGQSGFEPETVDLYFQLLKHSEVVFDIGANTGLFALLAAIDCSNREVHAFEPVPKIFNYLKKNVEINNLHNLRPVCNAVTNYDGEISLYIPHSVTLPYSSSTQKGFRKAKETIIVPALSLDTYITSNNISKVDLLKIDTEGTEHKVLKGAKRVLERDKPVIICEVLKGFTEEFLHHIFDGTEYTFFLITRDGLIHKKVIEGDAAYRERNYLFITKDKISRALQGVDIG